MTGMSGSVTHSYDAQLSVSANTRYYLTTMVVPPGSGTISPPSGWYNPGTSVTFTATPNAGNTFTGFTVDGIGPPTNTLTGYVITGTTTVVAGFSNSSGTLTISGKVVQVDGSALAGTPVTISGGQSNSTTADANGNYSFTVPSGTYTVTASSPYGVPVPMARTYTTAANFTGMNYTIATFGKSGTPPAGADCWPTYTADGLVGNGCDDDPGVTGGAGGIKTSPNVVPADGQDHTFDYEFLPNSGQNAQLITGCAVDQSTDTPQNLVTTSCKLPSSASRQFKMTFNAAPQAARGVRNVHNYYDGQDLISYTPIVVVDVPIPTPVITSVQPCTTTAGCTAPPATISPGNGITITGYNFGQGGTLKLCGLDGTGCAVAPYDTWSLDGTQVTASISQSPGTYAVQVEANTPLGYGYLASGSTPVDSNLWEVDVEAGSCAVPEKLTQVGGGQDMGSNATWGTPPLPAVILHFNYTYESSTGHLADLSSCLMGERVTYPGSGLYTFPSPPFPANRYTKGISNPDYGNTWYGSQPPNGNVGEVGRFEDLQITAGTFVPPYTSANNFTANQIYRYYCPCNQNGKWITIGGPFTINRAITSNSDGDPVAGMPKNTFRGVQRRHPPFSE